MKRFFNLKIEAFLSAVLALLGFSSCTRKVELEKPNTQIKPVKVIPKDERDKFQKIESAGEENVRSSYRVLYGPPPVSFRKVEENKGEVVEPVDTLRK